MSLAETVEVEPRIEAFRVSIVTSHETIVPH
jgi:hypothetical protein